MAKFPLVSPYLIKLSILGSLIVYSVEMGLYLGRTHLSYRDNIFLIIGEFSVYSSFERRNWCHIFAIRISLEKLFCLIASNFQCTCQFTAIRAMLHLVEPFWTRFQKRRILSPIFGSLFAILHRLLLQTTCQIMLVIIIVDKIYQHGSISQNVVFFFKNGLIFRHICHCSFPF